MLTKYLLIISSMWVITVSSCKREAPVSFEVVWSYEFKQAPEALSLAKTTPTIDRNQIYIAPDEILTTLDINNGNLRWDYTFTSPAYVASVEFTQDNQNIYIKENTYHTAFSFDKGSGTKNWEVDLPYEVHQFSNDGIDEQFLYLAGDQGEILRYSKSGEFSKLYDLSQYSINTDARSIRIVDNQLISSQRWRFTQDCPDGYCGRILSIDKETEEVLWEYRTDRGGFIFEPILLEEGILYAGVTDGPGEFVALNAANGEVIWKTLGVIGQSYTLTDSMVLVNDGISLLALDKSTGEELWNTGLAFGGGDSGNNIAYLDGYVYHSHSSSLWILEGRTGEIVHQEPRSPDGSPFGLLTAGNGKVFIQSDYALYAYTAWE